LPGSFDRFIFDEIQKMTKERQLHSLFIAEIERRLIGECQERILKCLDLLSEEDIWYRPNEHSNSMGNLVLHLCGNVTQWLFSTLGGEKDIRARQAEFDERNPIPRDVLKMKITELMAKADIILHRLEPADLLKTYKVQGYDESGVAILIHITEHFSYHVGQMTYFVKARRDLDVGYYAGLDLNKTSVE
jgi:uncharacterized damage-inducible protein DinB